MVSVSAHALTPKHCRETVGFWHLILADAIIRILGLTHHELADLCRTALEVISLHKNANIVTYLNLCIRNC
jgi:hypothetical protein